MVGILVLLAAVYPSERFVFIGEETLVFDAKSSTDGGRSGAGQSIRLGSRASTDALHAPSVTIASKATCADVHSNAFQAAPDASHGPVDAFDGLPSPPPRVSFAPGTADLSVPFLRTRTLAPGSYRNLDVGIGARVELAAGAYVFKRVRLAAAGQLVARGVVTIFVEESVEGSLLSQALGQSARYCQSQRTATSPSVSAVQSEL